MAVAISARLRTRGVVTDEIRLCLDLESTVIENWIKSCTRRAPLYSNAV